jgi:hypothetical protein
MNNTTSIKNNNFNNKKRIWVMGNSGISASALKEVPQVKSAPVAIIPPLKKTKGMSSVPPCPLLACLCGNSDFWLRPPLPKRNDCDWVCKVCHPPPPGLIGIGWYTVPPRGVITLEVSPKEKKPLTDNERMGLPPDYPPYPSPCADCGSELFWPGPDNWQCCTCKPRPEDDQL